MGAPEGGFAGILRLLDTDTCIAILRGTESVLERRAATPDDVATTWITAGELYYGAAKSRAPERNRALVTSFLATLPVIGLDELSAAIFGEAKALLERQGQRLADADLFIGAIAAARRATIVTGNRRHYERIPGVSIEDWTR
jgi:tRNA(fMet)-specific endonuclease VapC